MARPKKDESIKRTKNVMVRFTDVEYALVSCSAEQAGYPVAVYVRKQAITENFTFITTSLPTLQNCGILQGSSLISETI